MDTKQGVKKVLIPSVLGASIGFAGLLGYQPSAEALSGCYQPGRLVDSTANCFACEDEADGVDECGFITINQPGSAAQMCAAIGQFCINYL
jgi:hypothetical protein